MTWKEIKEEAFGPIIVFFCLFGAPFIAVAAVIGFIIYAIVALLNGCG